MAALAGGIWLFCAAPSVTAAQPAGRALHAQDHVLVKFRPEARPLLVGSGQTNGLSALLGALGLPAGAGLAEPALGQLLRERQARERGWAVLPPVDLDRFFYLRLPPGLSVIQCVAQLQHHPLLEYVEPDGVGTGGATIPNDPNFSSQWHHKNGARPSAAIQTPAAWDITRGATNIIVAVLDTGLAASQPEFTNRVMHGYNFVTPGTNTADDNGHGTAVAGTLAANANNGVLVAGVDWRCRLLPVKVMDQDNSGYYSWWAQGVDFAASNGARVINLSAGGDTTDTTLRRAITNAIARGVVFVTITHNNGANVITFPGNLTNCITVGATDALDRRCGFSDYGPQIDLVAPGTNIYTVSRSGTLEYWRGTSFSAPMAAGVCSLLASVRTNLTHEQARLLLCAGAEDRVGEATDTPGFDQYYGWGRLNAYNSLVLAQTRVDQVTTLTNRQVRVSWASPPNASNKQPYQIEFTTSVAKPWTLLTATNGFLYQTNRTFWTDDGTATGTNFNALTRYYRVRLRDLP
jgi:subtilisin family serine protease